MPRRIVVVEDNRADVFLIRESIEGAGIDARVDVVHDGEKAIQIFEQIDADTCEPCPALVILDINLPKRPGREVLSHIRRSRRCPHVSVLVVTSSDSERDRSDMSTLGVRGYFRKPSDYDDFMKLGAIVKQLVCTD